MSDGPPVPDARLRKGAPASRFRDRRHNLAEVASCDLVRKVTPCGRCSSTDCYRPEVSGASSALCEAFHKAELESLCAQLPLPARRQKHPFIDVGSRRSPRPSTNASAGCYRACSPSMDGTIFILHGRPVSRYCPDGGSESRQCHRTCPARACCFHHGNGTPVTARCIRELARPAAHASECAYSHP